MAEDTEQGDAKSIEIVDKEEAVPEAKTSDLPRLCCWERLFEVIATLITGVIFITKLLEPLWIFIASCALIWIVWCFLQFCRHGLKILFLWGVRIDQPNLRRSFLIPTLFAIVAIIFICVGAAVTNKEIRFDNWHLWIIFFLYPFYGVLQHVMLQSFLMRHISWCITGSDEHSVLHAFLEKPGLLPFIAVLVCVVTSATAFAFVHWPDPWLIAATGTMGVPWAIEYLLHRNVLPLGLYHGFLGTLFYFWFMGRDPLHGMF